MRKAKGDHLDRVYLDQMVLEMMRRGRLVLVIGAKSLITNSRKTISLESTQIRWFSWQSVERLDRLLGGQRRSKRELENDSKQPGDLTKNRQRDSLK